MKRPKTRHLVIILYWGLRRLVELVVLGFRSEDAKEEADIIVLRHQPQLLRRQVAGPDLEPQDGDQVRVAPQNWADLP